jgi:hypothetical protein
MVLNLAAAGTSAAADCLIDAEAEVIRRRKAALDRLAAAPATDTDERRQLRARRRKLKRGGIPRDGITQEEVALASAVAAQSVADAQLRSAYDADSAFVNQQLLRTLDDPRFQEAAIWQNAAAFRIACKLREGTNGRPARLRSEQVAMLIQRYAVKNDSIGFFGPVGWATVTDRSVVIDAPPPRELLARREVYFEDWCIDAIAARIAEDPRVKPWTAPRVKAGVWLGPDGVYAPVVGRVGVTTAERRVLAACDGITTAHEMASALITEDDAVACSQDGVYAILEGLVGAGLIAWRFEVAPQLHPEQELAARIARIGDPQLRNECDDALSVLLEGRARVARAAGQPVALAVAIDDLNTAFERATGRSPTRRHGQTYAARTLVYEDCRRAGAVSIGTGLMARLGPPLTIALDAVRWVAVQLACEIRQWLCHCHAEAGRGPEIDAHVFLERVGELPAEAWRAHAARIRQPFQAKWRSVLELHEGERHVFRPCDVIAARARREFAAPGAVWTRANYMSPDIMVAAAGLDALHRGAFHCVLGEVHSLNTILNSALFAQHPDPERVLDTMVEEVRCDLPILMQLSKAQLLARTRTLGVHPRFFRFEWGDEAPSLPRCRPLPAGRFVAINDGVGVRMHSRDGKISFDALELFGPGLSNLVNRMCADPLPSARHTPRVTIDDLTIARERWNIPACEIPSLDERDRVLQFASLRAWARTEGMPRQVFYLAPAERKPCYLDFNSPIYVDVFVRHLKGAGPNDPVRIVEMMPCIDDTWLTDAHGMCYTSELRFVARLNGDSRTGP